MARIAYDKLMRENSLVMDKADHFLNGLAGFTTAEKDHPFVESATFADLIKNTGMDYQSHWHFSNKPIFEEGYNADIPTQIYNVTWAIVIL